MTVLKSTELNAIPGNYRRLGNEKVYIQRDYMSKSVFLDIAFSGDSIVNRRFMECEHEGFQKVVKLIKNADVSYTHLETLFHEYTHDELYPSAVAAGLWMQAPPDVASDLSKMGFDMVSLAHNHALDYSYGGLKSTQKALDESGILHAGTGTNLFEAMSPKYYHSRKGTISLISMTSTFPPWSAAGKSHQAIPGRPGVNPLPFHHVVDTDTFREIEKIADLMGFWSFKPKDEKLLLNPPGLHNNIFTIIDGGSTAPKRQLEETTKLRILDHVQEAATNSEVVIVHIHNHEWDPSGNLSTPPKFIKQFARKCILSGADIIIAQGSHASVRGIESFEDGVIFYDPGELFLASKPIQRNPADFYLRHKIFLEKDPFKASAYDGVRAHYQEMQSARNPPGGYRTIDPEGAVIPICKFSSYNVEEIQLYPIQWIESPHSYKGLPRLTSGDRGKQIIKRISNLSHEYDTTIKWNEKKQIGEVKM